MPLTNNVIPIGHDNFVPSNKILAILDKETNPIKSMISRARMNNLLIDATAGRKLRTVILTTDHYVVLSSLGPKTIAGRYIETENKNIMSIGANNYLPNDKISSINPEKPRPIKRMIKSARIQNRVIDATMGKATKAIIAVSSSYIILSFKSPKSLANNLSKENFSSETEQ